MILTIDIGNTNIVIGLFKDDKILKLWRIHTDTRRTNDEYETIIRSFFRDENIDFNKVKLSGLSSVVPSLTDNFIQIIKNLTKNQPCVVAPDLFSCDDFPIQVPKSAIYEIGSDLVCNAVAAHAVCKTSCIVVDFGTALTFTAVDKKAMIQGVAIAPGLGTAVKALFKDTAQLPSVPLKVPESSLGKNSIESIQSGVVLGYVGLVESLIKRMRSDLGGLTESQCPIVATGGLSNVLQPYTSIFSHIDQSLTLTGLKIITEWTSLRKK